MGTLTYRMAAKTDVGRVRTNNEDNFQVDDNLSSGKMTWSNNRVCQLGEKGALLVVADGMGGMNAGEVASEIAINTLREYFATERLTAEVMANNTTIEQFMNRAVEVADENIKAEARRRPETKGMGTTIVIGWLYGNRLYVSWCGDSRAYVFNPKNGLHQLSKDHSYVQELVDSGRLRPEDAFDFPESNIITRCLSDSTTRAVPDNLAEPYEVCDGDIIMLCTDGLCGLLRDNEMARILSAYTDDMDAAVTALIEGACNAGGHDNVTVCLCQILSGGAVANEVPWDVPTPSIVPVNPTPKDADAGVNVTKKRSHLGLILALVGVFVLLVCGGVYVYVKMHKGPAETNVVTNPTDSQNQEDSVGPLATGGQVTGTEVEKGGTSSNAGESALDQTIKNAQAAQAAKDVVKKAKQKEENGGDNGKGNNDNNENTNNQGQERDANSSNITPIPADN